MKNIKSIYSTLILGILIVGCSNNRNNVEISPTHFNKPSTIALAQISGLEKPYFLKTGNQGILDFAINEVITDSVSYKVSQIDAKPIVFEHYYQPFQRSFTLKSFNVTQVPNVLVKDQLKKPPLTGDQYAPYDFRFLKTQYGVDYALVLEPRAFGTIRSYYGVIPTSAPSGYSDIKIYLIKLIDNTIAGYYNSKIDVAVKGDWDVPPDYTALVNASKESLIQALKNAQAYFFK